MANVTFASGRTSPVRSRQPEWLKNLRHDWKNHLFLGVGLLLSAIPIFFMLNISVKSQGQFLTNALGITYPFQWDNWVIAFNVLKRSILNSALIALVVTVGSLTVASIGAYVFARFKFPGRELLFWLVLGILFVPGILTFATRVVMVSDMKLIDTYWVMIIPVIAGTQIFEMFVLRAFFQGLSEEVMEAARVDGAGVWTIFTRIVIPMSRPILATLAVLRVIDVWNEWLWPLVTINNRDLRPMALQVFWLQSDMGAHVGRQMAGYAIASIPLLILFVLFSRQFVEGLTSGAIKW
jgi:ABC-type glycerol-3-phosphate transport system permease component